MADSPTVIQASDVRVWSGASVPTAAKTLSGTGSTEDGNDTALAGGEMATLLVGAVAVRVGFAGAAAAADSVATTDPIVAAYGRLDWMVTTGVDDFVYVEAADASSAYEAWAWTSSGPRSAS